MNVQCSQWSECGVAGGGCCALELYGGKPSIGICVQVCKRYDGPKVELPAPPPAAIAEPCDDSATHPGSLVKIILAHLGYKATSNCGCEAMCKRMNALGWWGCWKHRGEIVKWFRDKARSTREDL